MANFLSKPPETATEGERMVYNRLEQTLENEEHVLAYFEPDIGDYHPDFLILSPKYGILIIEIKDYLESSLKTINKSGEWEILNEDENVKSASNPFDQIYQYWRVIKDKVNKCKFPPEVQIPIQRIVIFSKISGDNYTAKKVKELAPTQIIVGFKEILTRNENFKAFFLDIVPTNLELTKEIFNLFRANIIPTCRLPTTKQVDLIEYFSYNDQVKLLDIEQEKLARELGEGHRLIFGVAESGKTILLIARARILAKQHPNWKILILCYNRLLKSMLFQMLNPQDYEDITISTFHSWARSYILNSKNYFITLYQKAEESAEKEGKKKEFFRDFVPNMLLELIKSQGDDKRQYDAILIDEAQDFDESWFLPIIKVLNPETNSLLIACDGLQGIYDRKKFHWSGVGIQAKGRVKRFERSYRIPIEIGVVAQATLPEGLKALIDKFDEFLSTKEFAGNHGSVEILISQNREEEYLQLSEKISRFLTNPQEVLVLFKCNMEKKRYHHPLFDYLKQKNIEWKDLKNHNFSSPGLLIGTLYGTKGLESDTIIIPELDTYVSDKDRQLLYVGMTRSRKKLILSANKSTELIKSLENYNKP